MNTNDIVHQLFEQIRSPQRDKLIALLLEASMQHPILYEDALRYFAKCYRTPNRSLLNRLTTASLIQNAECVCIVFINNERKNFPNIFSDGAMHKIYYRQQQFKSSTQLHHNDFDKLKVSDILEITGYVLKFSHAFLGKDITKYDDALIVLKSIDLALRNEPHDKPSLKATHLAIDVLSKLAQKMESDPTVQRYISGGTAIVQLAIQFFTTSSCLNNAKYPHSITR